MTGSYLSRLWSALKNDGMDLDKTENALCDGDPNQTISMSAALAQQAGKPWGCVLCAILSVLVQSGHCKMQLAGQPMTPWNYLRAVACLAAIPAVLLWTCFRFL